MLKNDSNTKCYALLKTSLQISCCKFLFMLWLAQDVISNIMLYLSFWSVRALSKFFFAISSTCFLPNQWSFIESCYSQGVDYETLKFLLCERSGEQTTTMVLIFFLIKISSQIYIHLHVNTWQIFCMSTIVLRHKFYLGHHVVTERYKTLVNRIYYRYMYLNLYCKCHTRCTCFPDGRHMIVKEDGCPSMALWFGAQT